MEILTDVLLGIACFLLWKISRKIGHMNLPVDEPVTNVAVPTLPASVGAQHALIYYRSQKSDGPFEGSMLIEKYPDTAWVDAVRETKQEIEKEHDARSPVMITYFTKL